MNVTHAAGLIRGTADVWTPWSARLASDIWADVTQGEGKGTARPLL